jgi:hypothetical protein
MWVFTEYGFFSIVRVRESNSQVLVRARSRRDLEELLHRHEERMRARHPDTPNSIPFKLPDIIETTDSDYRFRVFMEDSDVGLIMLNEVMGITYDNFKNRVAKVSGHERASDLHHVWDVMYRVQLREHGRQGFEFDPDFEVREGDNDIIDEDFVAPEQAEKKSEK